MGDILSEEEKYVIMSKGKEKGRDYSRRIGVLEFYITNSERLMKA